MEVPTETKGEERAGTPPRREPEPAASPGRNAGARRRRVEWLLQGALCAALLATLFHASELEFSFSATGCLRLLIVAAPMFLLASALSVFLRTPLALLLALLVSVVLGIAHQKKLALTNEPLSWTDITQRYNLPIALRYAQGWHVLLLLVLAAVVLAAIGDAAVRILKRKGGPSRKALLAVAGFSLLLLPGTANWGPAGSRLDRYSQDVLNIGYDPWNWASNVRRNGLYLHLLQTGSRRLPSAVAPAERKLLQSIRYETVSPGPVPSQVFVILCEGCWFDEGHFADLFAPLLEEGFRKLTVTAPVYGGGTVNSAFEMLTSLPANGPLDGVIYQEYGDLFSSRSRTVVSGLRDNGVLTVDLHNFHRKSWRRDLVLPRLGFDLFVSIEDMPYAGPEYFPDDRVLFDSALAHFKRSLGRGSFYHLETVSTHGGFPEHGDAGEGDYRTRMRVAISELHQFVREVRALSPDALVVVYADHKPALTRYFFDQKIIPEDQFENAGKGGPPRFARATDQQILGSVPLLIRSTDYDRLEAFARSADHKPLYCASAYLDYYFLGSGNLASAHVKKEICDPYRANYASAARSVPEWLYSYSLFEDDGLEKARGRLAL